MKKTLLTGIAVLFLIGTAHAIPRTDQEKLERFAHEVCRDLQTTSEAAYQHCYKEHKKTKTWRIRSKEK